MQPQTPSDYKTTLCLPNTTFGMRAGLSEREPKTLKQWQDDEVWSQLRSLRTTSPTFVLHDGPPYANGDLHHGHILNKVLKDMVVKDRSMAGFAVSFVPGWDCHGLPIEAQVERGFEKDQGPLDAVSLHQAARTYATDVIDKQRQKFMRLGVLADWQMPYLTMAYTYQANILRALADLFASGLIYKGLRPVHWCPRHKTALADAEIEYAPHTSPSAYVALKVKPGVGAVASGPLCEWLGNKDLHLLIWTTTPWTLPANVAVALHADAPYIIAKIKGKLVVVAQHRLNDVAQALHDNQPLPELLYSLNAEMLTTLHYVRPYHDDDGRVVVGDHVTMEHGTGLVHTAPGHGQDDFAMAKMHGLQVLSYVGAQGEMSAEAPSFVQGLPIHQASQAILKDLNNNGALLSAIEATVSHRFAHCWRCHRPVLTRATEQWWVAMDQPFTFGESLRKKALALLKDVTWTPSWGIERIGGMILNRPDWCLSRQRAWGVPIAVVFCESCQAPFISVEHMRHIADKVETKGAQVWWQDSVKDLMGDIVCAQCGHTVFRKETNILDVWFDSGCSFAAVLETQDIGHREGPPADLYLEGSDQHRGWFHSSLLLSTALRGRPPYRNVLTHGFVVDGQGKKLAKSLGNFTDPFVDIEKNGAELYRLWVASEDFTQEVRISPQIMRQVTDNYRKFRNTLRFLLGNLNEFVFANDHVTSDAMQPLDVWALTTVSKRCEHARKAFAQMQFHQGVQQVFQSCNDDLSSFYFDIIKDRLYADAKMSVSRRSALTALWAMALDIICTLAPVLAFTAEEAYQSLWATAVQHGAKHGAWPKSVHLCRYIQDADDALLHVVRQGAHKRAFVCAHDIESLRPLRKRITQALEVARREKLIGSSTEAWVVLAGQEACFAKLPVFDASAWADVFIVSKVTLDIGQKKVSADEVHITVRKAPGDKCPRCWLYRDLVGQKICTRCEQALT